MSSPTEGEIPSTLLLAIISGAVLLLYSLSRIMSLHRRVNDLEARPPVDDIVLRGIIRRQMNEMIEEADHEKAMEQVPTKPKNSSLKNKDQENKQEQPPAAPYFPDSFFSKISSNIVDVTPSSISPPEVIRVKMEKKEEELENDSVKSFSSETVEDKMEQQELLKTPPKKVAKSKKEKAAAPPARKIKKRGAKSQDEDDQESLNV
jgi:hypothetical protein